MPSPSPLQPGCSYHIFNRGINGENLFREERNYPYFLQLYAHHIQPVADTFAYCLMRNHLHVAVRIHEDATVYAGGAATDESGQDWRLTPASQAFANLFNAYTKAINKAYGRTGGLFANPFRRIHIQTDDYLTRVIVYIHCNPQKHGFVTHYQDWNWSSYGAILSRCPTRVQRDAVLQWFDGAERFATAHLNAESDAALTEQDFA